MHNTQGGGAVTSPDTTHTITPGKDISKVCRVRDKTTMSLAFLFTPLHLSQIPPPPFLPRAHCTGAVWLSAMPYILLETGCCTVSGDYHGIAAQHKRCQLIKQCRTESEREGEMGGETKRKAYSIWIRLSSTLPGPSPAAVGPEAAGRQAGGQLARWGKARLGWSALGRTGLRPCPWPSEEGAAG